MEPKSCICSQQCLALCMHQDFTCSWATWRSSSVTLPVLSSSIWVSSVETLLRSCFPSPVSPFSFYCFISVTGAPFLPSMWGLIAGLPRFTSNGAQSPSRSWLQIEKAHGCLGHPISIPLGSLIWITQLSVSD